MRYLKSAAFLLLTASSSVSLLPVAKAAPNNAQNDSAQSVEDLDTDAVDIETDKNPETVAQALPTAETTQSALSPNVADTPVPQFAALKNRVLGENAQPLTLARSNRAQVSATQAPAAQVTVTESIEPQIIAVEVGGETALSEGLQEEPQPEGFIQAPELTLDSFREMVNQAEADTTEIDVEVIDQDIAQNDETQGDEGQSLPSLEAPANAAESEAETPGEDAESESVSPESAESEESESEETPPPAPPLDSDSTESDISEPASAGPDESIPAPTATDETEIGELPAILFADPNPLSTPTSTEEVDIEQSPTITLEQAIELAYRNSQAVQAAALSQEQAAAVIDEARAALLPSVTSQVDLTSRESTQVNPFTGDADSELETTLGGSIGVNYDLFTGGSRAASIRTAELNEEIAALTLEAQQEQVRLATATAYYALQEAGENIGINQSFLDEAARNLRDAQLRQEVGVGTRFDVLRAEVQFANARQQLIQSQSQQQISRRDISRLLNLPPNASISATPVARAESWPLTLEESIVLAFQNRAELEQQLLQADVSEQQRRAALAALRPQVELFANYSIPDFFDDNDGLQDTYSFGAQLNWTIFEGGAARARARQQEIAGAIAEEQFSENLDQVRFDVEESFFNLQSSEENIATSEVAVAQAEEALALANLRLQAGVGTQLDVLTAQSELADARSNIVTAILGYNRALVSI